MLGTSDGELLEVDRAGVGGEPVESRIKRFEVDQRQCSFSKSTFKIET